MFSKVVTIISGIAAGLSVLALPIWILGVPGVENKYAKGWAMGFEVIISYPIAWLVNFAASYRLDESKLIKGETPSTIISLALLLVAGARLIQSFKTMQ